MVLSDLCIGHVLLKVFHSYPHLSVTSLTYLIDMEHEYPYPHETGATEESAFQLNCRFALRSRVDLQMQPRLKVQVFVVTLTGQPFSCMSSMERVLGCPATHTDWLLLVVQDANTVSTVDR